MDMITTSRTVYAAVSALLLTAALVPLTLTQASASIQTRSNATSQGQPDSLANSTEFEAARMQYLNAWNTTEFHVPFSTFIEQYSDQGYGVYVEHASDVFGPGDTITLYAEPVGFSHVPVLDEMGNTLYRTNLTARVAIEDQAGNLLATLEDLPPFEIVSHRKNTELFVSVTVTQQEPFPEGSYRLTYEISDNPTGETVLITKEIRIAQTVSS
jgi:hypothetical protein